MDSFDSLGAIDPRRGGPDRRIIECRDFSSSLRFAAGKYSPRWFAMSSLGGRCPKKLYIFLPLLDRNEPEFGTRRPDGEGGASTVVEVMGTPRPDMTDTVLARLVFF